MLPLHPTSLKGTPIHPRLRKSGAFWAVLCKREISKIQLGADVQSLIIINVHKKRM
ncbi:hypothetical protein Krac_6216 [Ktedonobacter racemifer DSM 44963]|uniref:Uncharacterized protein n=1 Tax=Ktedonobacter racemifer DSM 44963 TaxID=485913 RepID=D6TY69_KTERA|nr:hypothetical protein Krac_6216 [Ktedonobacter racemifer DSM 44963]